MTIVINVSPTASAETVRRQLARARSKQVAFNLPEGWTELDNMARMRLLQRQAQILRADVALITRHEATRKAAHQVGVPVFTHPHAAVHRRWRMKPLLPVVDPSQPDAGLPEAPPWKRAEILRRVQRPTARQQRQHRINLGERYRRALPLWLRWAWNVVMGLVIVLFLSGFVLYVLPAATLTLTPGQKPLAVDVRLIADPALAEADLADGLLPARLLETNIAEQGSIATTGSRSKATNKATGRVTFTNLGNDPVRVPLGTIINTSTGTPVEFRTTNEVTVPGGAGQRADAPVEAVEEGVQGNVLPNTINTVSGALRFRVRVTNPNGTSGGGVQQVAIVTQTDRDRLLAETTARAEASAYERLRAELEPGEWLSPASVQTFIIAQAFSGFNDEEADQLELNLSVLAQGTAVEDALISEAALTELRQAVPPRGRLVADTLLVQRQPGATAIERTLQFTVTASADYVIPIDPDEVSAAIAGLTPAAASAEVQRRWQLARPPEIYRDPEFLSTLPVLPNRIQVRVEYDAAYEGQ